MSKNGEGEGGKRASGREGGSEEGRESGIIGGEMESRELRASQSRRLKSVDMTGVEEIAEDRRREWRGNKWINNIPHLDLTDRPSLPPSLLLPPLLSVSLPSRSARRHLSPPPLCLEQETGRKMSDYRSVLTSLTP